MDTGNLLLVVAVGGIALYAITQTQRKAREQRAEMAAIAAQGIEATKAAGQRSTGEKIGGGVEAFWDAAGGTIKGWFD